MVQILAGVGLFFLGIIVGAVFHRSVQGEASKNKRLEQKLAELQERHSKYQADVSEHFMKTAQAVQSFNKSYRDVHTQLAKGASRLCNDEQADDFISLSFSEAASSKRTIDIDISSHAPPMDYAPKEDKSETGTLSESFGIQSHSEEEDAEIDRLKRMQQEPPRV